MSDRRAVELVLDMRDLHPGVKSPAEVIQLWSEIQCAIAGRRLSVGDQRPVEFGDRGTLTFTVLSSPERSIVVGESTAFAIHSIVELPTPARTCRLCAAAGSIADGPFVCRWCREANVQNGVCLKHAVILEGGLRRGGHVVAACIEHEPKCKCGQSGVFWCLGPRCRGENAWCAAHRSSHRNSPERGYCKDCYDDVFPQCSHRGCLEPGTNLCEHVDRSTGRPCHLHLCNRHVARWQVYGYERIGLSRCELHRGVRELSDFDVIWQVVAGTALRHLQKGGQRYAIPTLGSVKNILLKGRKQFYDENIALQLYKQLQAQLVSVQATSSMHSKMAFLVDRASSGWGRKIEQAAERKSHGVVYLERLKNRLLLSGLGEISATLEMTDFVPEYVKGPPPQPAIFVRMPAEHIGRFMGKGGFRKQELSQAIGCQIRLEKGL